MIIDVNAFAGHWPFSPVRDIRGARLLFLETDVLKLNRREEFLDLILQLFVRAECSDGRGRQFHSHD